MQGVRWRLCLYIGYSFFFFSSRRRHTRFDCDWSSDVCSSDLVAPRLRTEHGAALPPERGADVAHAGAAGPLLPPRLPAAAADERPVLRHVGPDRKSVV